MKFEQVNFDEAAGKTIKHVAPVNDDYVLVSFTDGTFSSLRADVEYADEDEAILDTFGAFDPSMVNMFGILIPLFGEEAADAIREDSFNKRMELQKIRVEKARELRREDYEKMKAEFEGGQ